MTAAKPALKPNGLDLETLEREGTVVEPYVFSFAGRTWTAKDPDDVDWQVVYALDIDNPHQVLAAYLGDEVYAEFRTHELAAWKVMRLLGDINSHYRPAAVAEGEGDGLPTS